jgi:hypothetical protein
MLWRFAAIVAVLCFPLAARAENRVYSGYELAAIRDELGRRGATLDEAPEGKRISAIEIVTLEVFDEHDPMPDFVNIFHTTTRKRVIAQELLFGIGDAYSQRRMDETARNLKSLIQLSLVLLVPVADTAPGKVRLLVITKDVWSLRLNSNFQVGPDGLTYLLLNPTEWNVAGTHANVGGLFVLKRSTYSAGMTLSHGRILGSRLAGSASGSIIFNRATGSAEGSFGTFSYGLPRYSEKQPWYYGVSLTWDEGLTRVSVRPSEGAPLALWPYHRERFLDVTSFTRSFGVKHKLELSFGAEADRRVYRSRAPADAAPERRAAFERREVPLSDTRVSPFFQLARFDNHFLKTIELETLGLQEDVRLGPELLLKLYPASTRLGSSRDMLGVISGLGYTQPIRDGLIRLNLASLVEYAQAGRHQAKVTVALRVASPRLGFGRFIFDGLAENRYQNYLRLKSSLGGDGRLRGYPAADTEAVGSASQRGGDLVAMNAEFRTSAVDILSAQCGLAAFYDMGGAAERFGDITLKESTGLGLRVLFPQLDRIVFRADWAFPLSTGYQAFPGSLFVSFGQAFAMPDLGGS